MTNFYGRTSDLAERRALNVYRRRRATWYGRVLEQSQREEEETMTLSSLLGECRLSLATYDAVYFAPCNIEARRQIYLSKPRRQPTQNVMTLPLEGRGLSQ
ncbi:hypothetical protein ACVIGB_006604 [Bradyrhizobium sp. USDA 4341]